MQPPLKTLWSFLKKIKDGTTIWYSTPTSGYTDICQYLWRINSRTPCVYQNPWMLKSHTWFSVSTGFESVDSMNVGWKLESTVGWIWRCKTHKCRRLFVFTEKSPRQSSNPSCSKVNYISKVNEITVSKRYLHSQGSWQGMEKLVSIYGWIDKDVVYIRNGILFSYKKGENSFVTT